MDLKEELAVKDHQLAELKEKIENHEVRDKLLEDTKARLESQLKEMQLELNQQLEKKGADYRGLQEHSTARGQEIVSLNEKLEVSVHSVIQVAYCLDHGFSCILHGQ